MTIVQFRLFHAAEARARRADLLAAITAASAPHMDEAGRKKLLEGLDGH